MAHYSLMFQCIFPLFKGNLPDNHSITIQTKMSILIYDSRMQFKFPSFSYFKKLYSTTYSFLKQKITKMSPLLHSPQDPSPLLRVISEAFCLQIFFCATYKVLWLTLLLLYFENPNFFLIKISF